MAISAPRTSVFRHSWTLLRTNRIIILPGLIVGVVASLLIGFFMLTGIASYSVLTNTGMARSAFQSAYYGIALSSMVAILGAVLVMAYTGGMALAAWTSGKASLRDGTRTFLQEGTSLFSSLLWLIFLGAVAALLGLVTFGFSILAYIVLMLYVVPAVVVDDVGAREAVRRSFHVAGKNILATCGAAVLIGTLWLLAGVGGIVFGHVPIVGSLIGEILCNTVIAYAMLFTVGEYLKLHAPAPTPPAQ